MDHKNLNYDIKFELFENGLDFLKSALEYLEEPIQSSNLKYAILHLCSGVELILKERLRREHWALLFKKIDKAKLHDYKNGDFESATFDDCINRLINICGINISPKNKNHLKNLRNKRNKLEHFGIVDTSEALKTIVLDALNVLIDFINDELEEEVNNDDVEFIREEILKIDEFVQQRLKIIDNQLNKVHLVVTCPRCLQDAATLLDGLQCLFCKYKNESPVAGADEFTSEVLGKNKYEIVTGGGEWPIYSCPSCEGETLVRTDDDYICFSCAERWEFNDIDECMRCGSLYFTEEDEISICDGCFEALTRE